MEIKIPYQNVTTADEAYKIVKETLTPELLAKFKVNPDFEYKEKEIIASGKGFSFSMTFQESEVDIKLDLGVFLKPFASQVMAGVEKQIKRIV